MLLKRVDGSPRGKFIAGSSKNFWIWSPENGWDLTHPDDPYSEPIGNVVHIDCEVSNITVDPAKTALVIVDMQNIALSKALEADTAPSMYKAQEQLIRYGIPAARALGFQVVWLNWGLTEEDIDTISPAEVRVFGFKADSDKADYGLSDRKSDPTDPDNFLKCGEYPNLSKIPGTDLGTVFLADGTQVEAGRAMMKNTWNTALHGPLAAAFEEGKKSARPDVWIDKYRNSGLWDATSECSEFLDRDGIRTLIFAGVNVDQCVAATLQDAHAKRFDTIMLKDGCATDSPGYTQEAHEYNTIRNWGFLTGCRALAKAAGLDWGKE